jgi:hypothetical protein
MRTKEDIMTFDNKYLVLKRNDIYKYLNEGQLHSLLSIVNQIEECRQQEGKSASNEYLIINTDESYAHKVAEIMQSYGHCHQSELGFFGYSEGLIEVK